MATDTEADPLQQKRQGSSSRSSSRKRNRGLLSCTECHRRKQKCNRLHPCNDCTLRGVPDKCNYQIPLRPNRGPLADRTGLRNPDERPNDARTKRIMAGNEVLLTMESVKALSREGGLSEYAAARRSSSNYGHTRLVPASRRFSLPSLATDLPGGLAAGVDIQFLGGMDPFSVLPDVPGEPVPKSSLIFHWLRQLAPWLSHYDDGATASAPKVSWLPFALHHPALFYATLLSAAVHLDRVQPLGDSRTLLWYKGETMRLTNERLSYPEHAANDEMILVALILLYFNVGGGDVREYGIHLGGINQMLTLRGGKEKVGLRGMVTNWLDICYGPWSDDWEPGQFE